MEEHKHDCCTEEFHHLLDIQIKLVKEMGTTEDKDEKTQIQKEFDNALEKVHDCMKNQRIQEKQTEKQCKGESNSSAMDTGSRVDGESQDAYLVTGSDVDSKNQDSHLVRRSDDESNNQGAGHPRLVLVLFHHQVPHLALPMESDRLLTDDPYNRTGCMVDVVFWQNEGMYYCDSNTRAVDKLVRFIQNSLAE